MATLHPSLFKLLGAGFLADRYAADGIHLRWMFDNRLGFPRAAVCLFRRPSLGTREGSAGVQWRANKWHTFPASTRLDEGGLRVRRASGATFDGNDGIALSNEPLLVEFSALDRDGAACFARVRLRMLDPGGSAVALAEYVHRDQAEPVDRAEVAFHRIKLPSKVGLRRPLVPRVLPNILREPARTEPRELSVVLEQPTIGRLPPKLLTPAQQEIYAHLLALDAAKYRTVSPAYLDEVAQASAQAKVSIKDIALGGVLREAELIVRADRIDRLALTGGRARLVAIEWVVAEQYVAAKGWQRVACVPAAGGDDDYRKRNAKHFGELEPDSLAKQRVFATPPRGAEPLDEPVFPPTRPPTDQERYCRYLAPWLKTFAPWFEAVLAESQGGVRHMSQVTRTIPITDLGQRPGEPMPEAGAGATMTVKPYNLLLAASTAFPVAQLLGLAHVDTADVGRALKGEDPGTWDYMAVGTWDRADVVASVRVLVAELQAAQQRVATASPAEVVEAQAELMAALLAIVGAIGELNALLASADGDRLSLRALKLGLRLAPAPDFTAPASVTPTFEETSVVEPGMGLVRLDWPLRQRARAMLHEAVPVGACIARGKDGAPLEQVLNPRMPELGECKDVAAALLPAGPPGNAGAPGIASHVDRAAGEGTKYRYGISEMDPFGRWSPFTEASFLWEDRAPPPAPPAIRANLESVGSGLRLRVTFHWDRMRLPPAGHAFHVGLRRDTALAGGDAWPADAAKRVHWARLSRTLGGATAAFSFVGDTPSGTTTSHDGLSVRVSFVDAEIDDGLGGKAPRRIYTVEFTGAIEVTRDAFLRARLYVGVASEKRAYAVLSDEVAGPAIADHIDPAVPAPTALPPEPLLASYADAEGFSTFKLTWNGVADTRYQVLRASERELLSQLPDGDPRAAGWGAKSIAERAALLRAFAPGMRKVFAPVSAWLPDVPMATQPGVGKLPTPPSIPAGPRSHVDRLPGRVDTLFVYAVLGRSASGEASPWPGDAGGFAAVRVPVAAPPSQPVIVRASWQPPLDPPPAVAIEGQARAELLVLRPNAGADPGAYEIFRATRPEDAVDERRMRRIHVAAPQWEDGGDGPDVARLVDPTVQPWRTYWYSVVARTGTPAAPGLRSAASRPIAVETAAPTAPAPPVWTIPFTEMSVSAQVAVDFPAALHPRFRVELWRTHSFTGELLSPREAIPVSVAAVGDNTLEVTVTGQLAVGSTVVLRVVDPLGRIGESAPWTIP